jgi:hypothetical protein
MTVSQDSMPPLHPTQASLLSHLVPHPHSFSGNDEITVSKDSIHILKHHGSYMQQNRDLKKKADREASYQFMLRLKVRAREGMRMVGGSGTGWGEGRYSSDRLQSVLRLNVGGCGSRFAFEVDAKSYADIRG